MIVFLRNIPGDTFSSEIADFIQPVLKGGFFRAKGEIKKIEILALRDKDINLVEYHALVYIEPEAAALRVIKKLHGQRFRDKRITVRQYHVRSWKNDKRSATHKEAEQAGEKRTNSDRRRNLEIMDEVTPQYSSRKSFHRRF